MGRGEAIDRDGASNLVALSFGVLAEGILVAIIWFLNINQFISNNHYPVLLTTMLEISKS